MKEKVLNLRFLLLFAVVFALIVSCGKEEKPGCTDPEALNYAPDTEMDDGSCEYARDKFLGIYSGTSECVPLGYWDGSGFQIFINEDVENVNNVKVTFSSESIYTLINWTATVDKNTLLFDDAINVGGINYCGVTVHPSATFKLKGTATFEGSHFSFPRFRFSVIDDATGNTVCLVVCEIEALKNI